QDEEGLQAIMKHWSAEVGDCRQELVFIGQNIVEWARLKANDSLECRNCHNFDYMDFTKQSPRARQMHSSALASGEATCIDCHKGIAHQLPDMSGVPGW
ncbi:NapC/NirT family cytochrome c, partial [Ectopseudomonas hydrolytica]|uniref:NapC/NirT family cytochrome c n=1 Tax=Ectopseudomonas hydrolytica TaxID=2493633 RepID=UPI003C2B9617